MVDQINFLSVPYFCSIILTSKCNLRCLHCLGDYAEECPDELSLEEWKKTIDEIARLKIFYLNISGGEPTIKPYFAEFLDYLSQKGIHFMLTTNGIISNKNITAIIRNRDFLIGVKISLDGYDEESHGYIRRGLNLKPNLSFFKRTMKTIKYFNSENVPLTIASVIHSHNIVHFDRFIEIIKEINPISWFMSPIIPSGRGNFYENIKAEYNYYDSNFWNILVKKCNNAIVSDINF